MNLLAKDGGKAYRSTPFPKWPIYDENEKKNLEEVLQSNNWWRVTGTKVKEFEREFSKFQDCQYCLGVTNGTSALELALSVLNIGNGDEVIVPAMTFVSTGLAVINCNATPVLVDIDKDTLCMLPEKFEQAITSKTKAVIPVHMGGNACYIEEICKIAKRYNIAVIEDAAHAHGAEYNGKRLGSFGDISIFSFQNGKLMTCGEGGAFLTNNKKYYEKAYLIQDVGRPKGDKIYQHLVRGSNYRMNEFQAAILLAQLERVNNHNKLREENASYLDHILTNISGITPQKRTQKTNIMSHYMYMFYYDKTYFNGVEREKFISYLAAEGIPANVCFPVLSELEFYRKKEFNGKVVCDCLVNTQQLDNAKKAADEVVWIHHRLLEGTKKDVLDIAGAIKKIQDNI